MRTQTTPSDGRRCAKKGITATSVRENSCSAVRPIEGSEKGRNMGETGWLLLRLHGVKKKEEETTRTQTTRQSHPRKKVTTALPHFGSQEVGGGGVCVETSSKHPVRGDVETAARDSADSLTPLAEEA